MILEKDEDNYIQAMKDEDVFTKENLDDKNTFIEPELSKYDDENNIDEDAQSIIWSDEEDDGKADVDASLTYVELDESESESKFFESSYELEGDDVFNSSFGF